MLKQEPTVWISLQTSHKNRRQRSQVRPSQDLARDPHLEPICPTPILLSKKLVWHYFPSCLPTVLSAAAPTTPKASCFTSPDVSMQEGKWFEDLDDEGSYKEEHLEFQVQLYLQVLGRHPAAAARRSSRFQGSSRFWGVTLHKCGKWEPGSASSWAKKFMFLVLYDIEMDVASGTVQYLDENRQLILAINLDECARVTLEGRMIVHIAVLVAQCTEGHGLVLSIVSPVCDVVDGPPG